MPTNKALRAVIFENVTKMLLLGLERTPYMRSEDHEDVLMETYLEAFEDAGLTDADAPRLSRCFRSIRKSARIWHPPRLVLEQLRIMYPPPAAPELPSMSPEQRAENLKRISELVAMVHKPVE